MIGDLVSICLTLLDFISCYINGRLCKILFLLHKYLLARFMLGESACLIFACLDYLAHFDQRQAKVSQASNLCFMSMLLAWFFRNR